jgi:diaminohydroxyphosphoribosylaminopyrimidine deaminase/5-amino-6-(5-phosphoribosylamino)uracil reductase
MDISEIFMSRCLELAGHGRGNVAPNPRVGAVIVSDGSIIGEGYHRCFGEAHAEVNAIVSVKDEKKLHRSTIYVNLEPCSHYGMTPPCVELIIRKKIPRVVLACQDPFPKIAGRGIKRLQDAGIEVITGVMEREATKLNRFFITAHRRCRPYIILKWAQSEDGFIDHRRKDASEKPAQFSTPLTRMMVHRLRSEVQAILVGTNTAVMDNPALTVRYWSGKSPVRVLIDRNLRVPPTCRLFDGAKQTLVFTKKQRFETNSEGSAKVNYIQIDDPAFRLSEIAARLYQENIHSLLVEGGARLHGSFLEENLCDELIIETKSIKLHEGVKSPETPFDRKMQLIDRQFVLSGMPADKRVSMIERFSFQTL